MFAFTFILLLSNAMVSFCEPIRSMSEDQPNCILGDWSSTNGTLNVDPPLNQGMANCAMCRMTLSIEGNYMRSHLECDTNAERRKDPVSYCNDKSNGIECVCNGDRCNSIPTLYANEPAFKEYLHKESENMKIQFNRESGAIEIIQS